CRFIIGRFGSGKTFFLNLLKTVALQKRFVVLEADITTDRRLHGSAGQARSLYSELLLRLATRAKPEGGALSNLVERWVGDVDGQVREKGGTEADVRRELLQRLKPLNELV
ncbi:MAG: BREX system ATP-binding domain-containing protein, partial [Candidatus Fonsibacter sp.]